MDLTANVERFKGFADLYERYRPRPPEMLDEVLGRYAGISIPELVVDLGCGTGLSTRYWADKARQVIGIDPSADMLQQARKASDAPNISYQEGFSHQTGLPDKCAQVVTVSQALHWMDPQPTFEEAARILQPGGVFTAYDCDWPPVTFSMEAEKINDQFMSQVGERLMVLKVPHAIRWEKSGHLMRMEASGCFRYTREIVLHQADRGNAERLIGLVQSQGSVQTLLKNGFSLQDLGFDNAGERIRKAIGEEPRPWMWCYRMRLGIV